MGESLQGSRLQIVREVLIETGEANNMTNFKVYEEKRNPSGVRLVLSHGTDGQETQRRERHLVNCWRADTSKKKKRSFRITCKVADYGKYLEENTHSKTISLLEVLEIFNL